MCFSSRNKIQDIDDIMKWNAVENLMKDTLNKGATLQALKHSLKKALACVEDSQDLGIKW